MAEKKKLPQIVEANEYLIREVIKRGISDVQLEKATGSSRTNYNAWRNSIKDKKRYPLLYDFKKLAEIAEVLGIKTEIIFKQEDE